MLAVDYRYDYVLCILLPVLMTAVFSVHFFVGVDVPEGSGPLAFMMAQAGISSDMFNSVGA